MAKEEKKEEKPAETVYRIPLRDAYGKHSPKKSIKAVKVVREFLGKHNKGKDVKISVGLNDFICSRGRPKPPRSVRVKAVVEGDKVTAELAE